MKSLPYLILAAFWVVIDQVVKLWVRTNVPYHLPFLPGLDLTFVKNTGAAFSLLSEHTWLLTVLSGVVSLVLLVVLVLGVLPQRSGKLALALLLGGAVGNFIDRLVLGYVTDMFAATFIDFPIFNVADVGIVIGGVLLCLYAVRFMGKSDDAQAENTEDSEGSEEKEERP